MKTPAVSIFLLTALLGAAGQFLCKSGAERAGRSLAGCLLNGRLLGGVVCYSAVMVLFVAAFKRGGALTTLYPVYASTFVSAVSIACGRMVCRFARLISAGCCSSRPECIYSRNRNGFHVCHS